ncbi:hypothetical protein H0H93_014709 [Arthromyces matolae]|nr:hypothetical protein H0H93_014709 [Arthromyces matolae]
MLTPPLSLPPKMRNDNPRTPVLEAGTKNFLPKVDSKRHAGCRLRWSVVLVPLFLVLITACTRYLIHPSAFDLLASAPESLSWHEISSQGRLWHPHKRHEHPERRQVTSSLASTASPLGSSAPTSSLALSPTTTTSSAATANAPIPTIPSSPPTLPTPFPQPLDANLTQNFSSVSCFNFFANMTAALPFRSCRAMSLLMDSSAAFTNAQTNLTLMNTIIWGTCNTSTDRDQCVANMGWYADALEQACTQDIQDKNTVVVSTLQDLRAYSLMREAACLTDPTANTYCYLNAVRESNPSDLYFYTLYQGIPLPNSTTPSCSACGRSLLSTYAQALSNTTQSSLLTGLQKTYDSAAKMATSQCGTGYAETSASNGSPPAFLPHHSWSGLVLLLLGAMVQALS